MHVARARHAFSHMPSRPHVHLPLYLTASCRAWQACHAVFDNFLHAFARTRSSLNNARRAREARHEITYGCRTSARDDDEKIARDAIVSRARTRSNIHEQRDCVRDANKARVCQDQREKNVSSRDEHALLEGWDAALTAVTTLASRRRRRRRRLLRQWRRRRRRVLLLATGSSGGKGEMQRGCAHACLFSLSRVRLNAGFFHVAATPATKRFLFHLALLSRSCKRKLVGEFFWWEIVNLFKLSFSWSCISFRFAKRS